MRLPSVTLDRFVRNNQSLQYDCTELSQLLSDIVLAAKIVNREVNKAGLVDIFGQAGSTNTSGEQQYKLDLLANASFEHTLRAGGQVCALLSEEEESFITLNESGNYVIAIDPIDGSSNIDFGISIGTIFSIYKRVTPVGTPISSSDIFQKGSKQLAAGYVLYGSSNVLVYTSGHGVNGFTFEPGLGEYLLSHPDIRTPNRGLVYSINEGLSNLFPVPVRTFLDDCKTEHYAARYTGSLVADFHRNLLKGGIYLYPGTVTSTHGKLRLVFECNALAFIAEQAGGLAVNDTMRILDIEPQTLHQRTSLYVGSSGMVEKLVSYLGNKPGV
ncbi:MAG TPA: class 1 fructose-bisphosphatase [Cyclobacteriaceae bacterium]|nr:class 1 fructose-bisphosphatase [Cyclobacteriaceae bacterium]